jgi:hypothetical protein
MSTFNRTQRRLSGTIAQAGDTIQRASCFVRTERVAQQAVRNGPCLRACLLVVLTVVIVCAYFIPQFMTGASSFEDAEDACRGRFLTRLFEHGDPSRTEGYVDMKEAEEHFEAKPASQLYPTHIFNSVSTFFSLACFMLWVYVTPHYDSSEAVLDQRRDDPPPPPLFRTCHINGMTSPFFSLSLSLSLLSPCLQLDPFMRCR